MGGEQVDEFVERGWTLLKGAFPVPVARAVRREPRTAHRRGPEPPRGVGPTPGWLKELLTEPHYTGALTERFTDAVDQLVGSPGTLYCPARRSAGRAVPPKRAVAGKEYPAPDLHDPAVRPQAR